MIERSNELRYQSIVKQIYQTIEPCQELSQMEAIEKDWLIEMFKGTNNDGIRPISNAALLCPHQKLDMNSMFKLISTQGAELIFSNFKSDNVRIKLPEYLCLKCVNYKLDMMRIKDEVDSDSKTITSLLKFKNSGNEKNFWIGKESFRRWKQIRMNLFKRQFVPNNGDEDFGKFPSSL